MVCVTLDKVKGAVVVPIVSRHELSDTSCQLDLGDHEFIKHESCAAYDFARLLDLNEANGKIDKKQLKLREPVEDGVLKRLQVGLVISDETAPWIFQAANGAVLSRFLKLKGLIK